MNELAYIAAVILSGNRNMTPDQAVASAQDVIAAARRAESRPDSSAPERSTGGGMRRRIDPENVQPISPAAGAEVNRESPGHVVTPLEAQPPAPHTVPQPHQPAPLLQQPPQPKHPDAVLRDELLKQAGPQQVAPVEQPEPVQQSVQQPAVHPVARQENK